MGNAGTFTIHVSIAHSGCFCLQLTVSLTESHKQYTDAIKVKGELCVMVKPRVLSSGPPKDPLGLDQVGTDVQYDHGKN